MGEKLKEKDREIDDLIGKLFEISPENAMEKISGLGLEKKERVLANEEPVL